MTSVPVTDAGARLLRKWAPPAIWAVLTVALVIGARNLPWGLALQQTTRVELRWLLAATLANLAILPMWAAEWRLLIPGMARLAYARMFEVVAVTGAVLNSIPFFAGEASGVALLIARGGLSRGAALSVLAMDQLLVGFAKVSVLAATALIAPIPDWLRAGILSLVVAVAAMVAVLLTLAHRWIDIRDRLLARPSKTRRAAARLAGWGVHFDALRDGRRAWRVAMLALGKKGAELLAIVAIQMAFGMEPSIAVGLFVLSALAITTLLPVAPANVGVYEATVFAAYTYVGVSADVALGLAIVQHLCFLLPALVTGYLTITMRQLKPDRLPVS